MTVKYSNVQKIEAVREFVKYSNQSEAARDHKIPAVNLMRWRYMIKNEVFQSIHCDRLYKSGKQGQRTKFLGDRHGSFPVDQGPPQWRYRCKS